MPTEELPSTVPTLASRKVTGSREQTTPCCEENWQNGMFGWLAEGKSTLRAVRSCLAIRGRDPSFLLKVRRTGESVSCFDRSSVQGVNACLLPLDVVGGGGGGGVDSIDS